MKTHETQITIDAATESDAGYAPPSVTFLGTLTELTQEKEVNAADGSTFLGIDVGS